MRCNVKPLDLWNIFLFCFTQKGSPSAISTCQGYEALVMRRFNAIYVKCHQKHLSSLTPCKCSNLLQCVTITVALKENNVTKTKRFQTVSPSKSHPRKQNHFPDKSRECVIFWDKATHFHQLGRPNGCEIWLGHSQSLRNANPREQNLRKTTPSLRVSREMRCWKHQNSESQSML